MSRVGIKPVSIPKGAKVTISDRTVTVEGPKGSLSFTHREEIKVGWSEDEKSLVVAVAEGHESNKQSKAFWGTTRSILDNMMLGVTEGYKRSLEVVGVGWNAQVQGQQLRLNLGYASPVMVDIPTGVNVSVEKQIINVEGADKQAVGQFAAATRAKRKPEPYNGKGIKYTDEVIRRKQGKQFGS